MILILSTGGTIENLEYPDKQLTNPKESIIPDLINRCRINTPYRIEKVCHKDSRFIDEEDLIVLGDACKRSKETKILITHGTLTMIRTAKYLMALNMNKTIVLTGAAIKTSEPNSDALFNVGFALGQLDHLKKGVYIAMNGMVFNPDSVQKDAKNNRFSNI